MRMPEEDGGVEMKRAENRIIWIGCRRPVGIPVIGNDVKQSRRPRSNAIISAGYDRFDSPPS